MDAESVDDSTRSSVSSLKSRFEQLASREVKGGPEERPTQNTLRPSSQERKQSLDEQNTPRGSFDGSLPVRAPSPQPPPRPKPKPRIDAPERPGAISTPPKTPQLLPTPRLEGHKSASTSPRQPVITVESPHSSPIAEPEASSWSPMPPPTPSRPQLPPRSSSVLANVTASSKAPPPISPRPVPAKPPERVKTPDFNSKTPPLPPERSPQIPPTSPFTTPPELRRKYSPPTKANLSQSIPVPTKLTKPALANGIPIQTPPELPQRPTSPPVLDAGRPLLPPRPILETSETNTTKRVFERPPPSRFPAQSLPQRPKPEKVKTVPTLPATSFPPPPKRTNSIPVATPPTPILKEKEIPPAPRTNGSLFAPAHNAEASSGTDLDIDGSSSEAEEAALNEKTSSTPSISLYPDASRANRRPPLISGRQVPIQTNMPIKHVCISGPYIGVSTPDLTKVYNVKKDTNTAIWSYTHTNEGYKVTSIEFKPSREVNNDGQCLWIGTDKGSLMEFDITRESPMPVEKRGTVHTSSVNAILRCRMSLWSIDESGKVQVWTPSEETGEISMANTPRTFRVMPRWTVAIVAGWRLWLGQGKQVQVYSPLLVNGDTFNVTQRGIALAQGKTVGAITCGTTLPSDKDRVFLGHDDGKVSIYSQSTLTCLDVVPINIYNIVNLAGVGEYLWAGFRTGMVYVYDTNVTPWRVCKDWDAHHKMKVTHLLMDQTSLWRAGVGMVTSVGEDGTIKVWDALLMDDWLENEMQKREEEYCSFRDINIVVCTWNAGASTPSDLGRGHNDQNFLENVLNSTESPDIIVFGFQELVDLENKKLTAKSILKGKSKNKAQPAIQEHMSRQYRVWQEKLVSALRLATADQDDQYVLLHSATLVGLFTCIFIRYREKQNVRKLSATEVKTGLGGLHGNKGALVVRFMLDDSSLCFVNCHLAAGQRHAIHRNNDIANILESAALPPELNDAARLDYFVGGGDGSMVLDHEICVLSGDMNYRIDLPRDIVMNAIRRNDIEKLLEHDQLLVQRRKNPGLRLRPFSEAPITFAPTYKYNVGSDEYDTSEKKRTPAYCDRIYYRGAMDKITPINYQRHEVYASDHRPVSGAFVASVKMVDGQRKSKVWDETAKLWISVAQKAIDDSKIEYISETYGFDENTVSEALQQRGGKVMDTIRVLGG